MSRNLGTLEIDLTLSDLTAAIKKLDQLDKDIETALDATVQELAKQGEVSAKIHLYSGPRAADEPDYGDVAASIHYKLGTQKNVAYVYADSDEAAYLEYGTGIAGAAMPHEGLQSGESTAPVLSYVTANGDTHLYTAYDTYRHGMEGWRFRGRDGSIISTIGFPARAFMYNALRDLEKMAPEEMMNQIALQTVRRFGR